MLNDGAAVLESLVSQTLGLMNEGHDLDAVLQRVRAPQHRLARPYLLPEYDDPEFVVRSLRHLHAGWFDGNPAHLKPAPAAHLAAEIAALAGGAERLAQRASALAEAGRTRLAAHPVELACAASPTPPDIPRVRALVYARCAEAETSLIGKAIFRVYERDAQAGS